jgi:hypothetical protein
MKIELQREKPSYAERQNDWFGRQLRERLAKDMPLTRSLPFFFSPQMSSVHRPRWATLRFRGGAYRSISVSLWCGQINFILIAEKETTRRSYRAKNRFVESPPLGYPVCGTCEGRAIGAGALGSRMIAGEMLVFTPQI